MLQIWNPIPIASSRTGYTQTNARLIRIAANYRFPCGKCRHHRPRGVAYRLALKRASPDLHQTQSGPERQGLRAGSIALSERTVWLVSRRIGADQDQEGES